MLKLGIFSAGFFKENSLIVAWRFRIQDSRFKKESMKMPFQKNNTDSSKAKHVPTIFLLWGFYFTQKLVFSSAEILHENSLIVAWCSFGRFEIWTPNRFKTQANDTSKLLACNSNSLQEFVKQKKSLSIIVLSSKNFLKTFVKITILGNLYQYSSC